MDAFLQQLLIGFTNGMVFALIALGYTMVYGILELINFAHGDLFMLASFLALTLIGALGLVAASPAVVAIGLIGIVIACAAFGALLNYSVDRLVYKPLRNAPKLAPLVSAIGVSFIFQNLGLFWGGIPMAVFGGGGSAAAPKAFPNLLPNTNLFGESAIRLSVRDLAVIVSSLTVMGALYLLVRFTKLGKAMRATAQNPTAARLMGIDVDRVIGSTFLIGGGLAGFAAVVYGLYINTVHYQIGYQNGLYAFTAAVLGGIGNIPGAVLGGLVIGLVRAFSDQWIGAQWQPAVLFGMLIVILIFRPSGLLGAHVREGLMAEAVARRAPSFLRRHLELVVLALFVVYPLAPVLDWGVARLTGTPLQLDRQLVNIFIFAILSLALNLQVGYAGLLQLGVSAFFAIGAYATGILTVAKYPFQIEVWGALALAPIAAGIAGITLGAPMLRLRGDYLAIVTLGFAEVMRVVLINLENITDGPRGLNPIPEPWLPESLANALGGAASGKPHFFTMYYLSLLCVVALVVVFRNLERSRLGRSFVALREDELASACMGLNPVRTKLIAFAAGAAVAGLAGALYAANLTTTAEPNTYDFNYSIMVLCCIIIGGLGSIRGALLGAAVLLGFDNVVSPLLTRMIQKALPTASDNVLLSFSNWRWLIFGFALVLMMRLRPEGLWPSERMKAELHHGEG